jgi:hypothetical protein
MSISAHTNNLKNNNMKEQPNIPLLVTLALIAIGLLIAIGGFDDAAVRDLDNQHLLQPIKLHNK